ncbi:DEAD/DEAH box helicase [Candidatus Bipolaricaulota bacterium]
MSFEQFAFDRRIAAGVKSVGYTTPTPIQKKAIPVVLQGRDILGLAQTGTGKTAAFVLPILQRLSEGPRGKVRALIVAPTRELAEQIHQDIVKLGRETKVRSVTVYGGVSKGPQLAALRRGVEIVVACPGRLLDHVDAGDLNLSHVEVLVLDEADRMCDMGFLPDIRRIIRQVPEKRQTLFFSATMPRDIRVLADRILDDPETVQIGMIAPAETVSHALYPVPESLRKELLIAMLRRTSTGRVLIFTRTKHRAKSLAVYMKKQGYRAAALQGNMSQSQRQHAIDGFRNGKIDMLVATDIAARGIDVSKISHVVNFDMPNSVDAYTHRIGRTGRIGRSGEAFTFAVRGDTLMVRQIEKTLGTKLERRRLPDFDYGGGFDPERQFPRRSGNSTRPSGRTFRSRSSGRRSPR